MWKPAPEICLGLAACATGTAIRGDRDPQLPSADDTSRRIRNDEALVRDMSDWQLSETPALQRQSCGIAKVSYCVN